MAQAILKVFATLFFAFVLFNLLIVFIKIVVTAIRLRPKRKASLKRRLKHFLYGFMNNETLKTFDFIKWVVYDFIRGKDKLKIFGIWAFTGYFGQGKTLGAVTLAKQYQKQYPQKDIKIYTNFNMKGQTGKITCWEDFLNLPKCTIVIFDEIQSTFTSQKFKDFPIDLLWKITQCRKNQLMVFCSTPVFHRMAIQIRENVDFVVTCKNILTLDRYFRYVFYKAPEYEKYQENVLKLFKAKEFMYSFIATDKHYRAYDTHEIVDRMDIEGKKPKKVVNIY